MSTADPGRGEGMPPIAAASAGSPGTAQSIGFPADVDGSAAPAMAALIARLGSAMLSSLPGATPPPGPGGPVPSRIDGIAVPAPFSAAPDILKTAPAAVPVPGEEELRSLLAPRLEGSSVSRAGAGDAMHGGVPYFLQDAAGQAAASPPPDVAPTAAPEAVRLSSPVPKMPAQPAMPASPRLPGSAVPLPGEAEVRRLLAPVLSASVPPVPGSASHPGAADAAGRAFYFLDGGSSGPRGVPSLARTSAAGDRSALSAHPPFDVEAIRRDFPILQEQVKGRPLVWLDNGATTQKPQVVIDRLVHFYRHENSNIHRAAHTLAARATDAYEAAREKVRRFMNASSVDEIVFARGATEAINLVARTWGRQHIAAGDEILITWLEHHANIVPWQMLAQETGAKLRVAPVDDRGQVLLDEYERLLGPRTRLVAFTRVSNALGTITPAARMIEMAKRYDAKVLVDGAQSVSHLRTDVQELDCDFFAFSGHKIFAPTGIGVLYGKREVLEGMPPWQGGGNMIADVTFEKTEYQAPPQRFEAGTGNIADAVGLGAALDYVERIGLENIAAYEHDLLAYASRRLQSVPGLRQIGTAPEKAAVISFVLDGFRSEDVGAALDQDGIAVRAGHHCAQPILRRFGLESTVRPSLAFYNTTADIDALTAALVRIASRSPNLD